MKTFLTATVHTSGAISGAAPSTSSGRSLAAGAGEAISGEGAVVAGVKKEEGKKRKQGKSEEEEVEFFFFLFRRLVLISHSFFFLLSLPSRLSFSRPSFSERERERERESESKFARARLCDRASKRKQ